MPLPCRRQTCREAVPAIKEAWVCDPVSPGLLTAMVQDHQGGQACLGALIQETTQLETRCGPRTAEELWGGGNSDVMPWHPGSCKCWAVHGRQLSGRDRKKSMDIWETHHILSCRRWGGNKGCQEVGSRSWRPSHQAPRAIPSCSVVLPWMVNWLLLPSAYSRP